MIAAAVGGTPCPQCSQPNAVGALLCNGCGMPLVQAGPIAAVGAPVKALSVVEGGTVGARIALPLEGQEITLGRHDLLKSPPWVVDVDLGRLMGLGPNEGPPVSRDQAVISRRAGEVLMTPRGQAPSLHKPAGAQSYTPMAAGTPQPIRAGDRIAFGHGGRVLVLEAQ